MLFEVTIKFSQNRGSKNIMQMFSSWQPPVRNILTKTFHFQAVTRICFNGNENKNSLIITENVTY